MVIAMPHEIPPFEPPVGAARQDQQRNTPDPMETLRAELDAERRAREQAESRANEFAQNAHQAKIEVVDNQLQLVNSAIARVQESQDTLRSAYANALRSQNYEAAAQIQQDMSDSSARMLRLQI